MNRRSRFYKSLANKVLSLILFQVFMSISTQAVIIIFFIFFSNFFICVIIFRAGYIKIISVQFLNSPIIYPVFS